MKIFHLGCSLLNPIQKGEIALLHVRAITADEVTAFAAFGRQSGQVVHDVATYLEAMLAKGAMRREWCFVLEKDGAWLGRLAFWTLPGSEVATDVVLWDVPWEAADCARLGLALFREACLLMGTQLDGTIGHVVDTPPMTPQWQTHPAKRQAVLEAAGFQLSRMTDRFDWHAPPDRAQTALGHSKNSEHEIVYRTMPEVGEAAFVDAIERVSRSTFDQYIVQERQAKGAAAQAEEMFRDLQRMAHQPKWWQLAYTRDAKLIGLLMPTVSPTYATIGYIGVLPEQRGNGYIHPLLRRATELLLAAGQTYIRADTDQQNKPMAHAFLRAGYRPFASRLEYSLVRSP